MPDQTRELRRCRKPGYLQTVEGKLLAIPSGWVCLPPGDAVLSRRLKAGGPTWTVIEIRKNKRFSHGIWAPSDAVESLRSERAREIEDPLHQRKLELARARRRRAEDSYCDEFRDAVIRFLNFDPLYHELALKLAERVCAHATPVGSGTVARTRLIPLEKRAEAAVIAWMRHQTSDYDDLYIEKLSGERRKVRQEIASESRRLLRSYRAGQRVNPSDCPLQSALGC